MSNYRKAIAAVLTAVAVCLQAYSSARRLNFADHGFVTWLLEQENAQFTDFFAEGAR